MNIQHRPFYLRVCASLPAAGGRLTAGSASGARAMRAACAFARSHSSTGTNDFPKIARRIFGQFEYF